MSDKKNLFICMTPLQILIARSVIVKKKMENYSFLIFHYNDNEKYKYYINLLRNDGVEVLVYQITSKTKFERFFELWRIRRFLHEIKKNNFNSIYLSSVDNALIHAALQDLSFEYLYTFDDGLANLYADSSYYLDKEARIQKIIKKFLGIKWSLNLIKGMSATHYSIYKNRKNIIDRVDYIDLIPSCGLMQKKIEKREVLKLYIGQPLHEVDACFTKDFIKKALKKCGVKSYFPHPRENVENDDFNYIRSNLILEDFYVELSNKYDVQLYTFFSTAVLNIKMLDREIRSFILFNDYLIGKYKSAYTIFDKDCTFLNLGDGSE